MTLSDEQKREIEQNERIQVYRGATIEETSGQPGQFDVKVNTGSAVESFKAGAIVQAAEFEGAGNRPLLSAFE